MTDGDTEMKLYGDLACLSNAEILENKLASNMDYLKAEIAKKRKNLDSIKDQEGQQRFLTQKAIREVEKLAHLQQLPKEQITHDVVHTNLNSEHQLAKLEAAEICGSNAAIDSRLCDTPPLVSDLLSGIGVVSSGKLESESVPVGNDSDLSDEEDNRHKKKKSKLDDQNLPRDINGNILFTKIAPALSKEKVVIKYFKSLLRQWKHDLEEREESSKWTAKGKTETATQKQCKDYISPLFQLCKHRQVDPDILDKVFSMVSFCEEGNFKAANDQYLQCAIGNAAWPIGLTMVGIHERSGRERINTAKIAHIMNNEQERKYLSSVKRLLTYAQSKRPDVPPSMKVL